MAPEAQWLVWARELQAIGQIGLTYAKDPYDRERFQRIRELSVEIMEHYTEVPTEKLIGLFASETGYQTPKVDVRVAVFRDDTVLMVRETSDGRWTLPGGWADVGCTPGQMAARETREEASAIVTPRRVIAVLDKAAQGYRDFPFSLYTLFVEADLVSLNDFAPNNEILERGFFAADSIPELSAEKITAKQVALCFTGHRSATFECVFD